MTNDQKCRDSFDEFCKIDPPKLNFKPISKSFRWGSEEGYVWRAAWAASRQAIEWPSEEESRVGYQEAYERGLAVDILTWRDALHWQKYRVMGE